MKKNISLSIFFPAYNEEANIEHSVSRAIKAVEAITDTYEIIIVNDGSRDRTGEIADRLSNSNEKIRVIHHFPNQGYGAAVWSGIQAARYEYVFFTDADLQFDLAELKKLVEHIPEYRMVIGYREKRMDPFMRLLNAKGWNLLNRLLFGLKARDIDSAFKLFERDLVANLPIVARGAMLSAEMLIRLQRQGTVFKEIPVKHLPRTAGSPTGAKPSVIFRAFREMLKLYFNELGFRAHLEVVKSLLVGVANTLIDLGVYVLITRGLGLLLGNVVLAKAISYFVGSVFSFIVNRSWTFNVRGGIRVQEVVRFYTTSILGLGINALSMYALVHVFHLYDLVAIILATVITFAWNFTLMKFWVYTGPKDVVPAHSVR